MLWEVDESRYSLLMEGTGSNATSVDARMDEHRQGLGTRPISYAIFSNSLRPFNAPALRAPAASGRRPHCASSNVGARRQAERTGAKPAKPRHAQDMLE